MKPNHHPLAYKMRAKPNKTYKDLKQTQKARIANWMFQAVCEYYKEYGAIPEGEAVDQTAARIYEIIKSVAIWVPYNAFYRVSFISSPAMEPAFQNKGFRKKFRQMFQKRTLPLPLGLFTFTSRGLLFPLGRSSGGR